jgi:hypothetical protein
MKGLCGGDDHFAHESGERRWSGVFGGLGALDPDWRGRFNHGRGARSLQRGPAGGRSFDRALLDRGRNRSGGDRASGPFQRGSGLGRRLGLDQPGKSQLFILFLIFLAVGLRAELGATPQTLEKGELLPAEKTLHIRWADRHKVPGA